MAASDLVPLQSVEIDDFHGWGIDLEGLHTYPRGQHPFIFIQDSFVESSDARFACLTYTIFEQRMGWYMGHVAVFESKSAPRLLAASAPAMFYALHPVEFFGDFCILRGPAYHKDPDLCGDPLVVLNLVERTFGYLDVTACSLWYDLVPTGPPTARLSANQHMPEQFTDEAAERIVDLSSVQRYPLFRLSEYTSLFWEERQAR